MKNEVDTILRLNYFESHNVKEMRKGSKRIEIELIFLPPYSPELNPIKYCCSSMKRIIWALSVGHIYGMRDVIKEAFYQLSRKISFAVKWVEKFPCPCYDYFSNIHR